MKTYQLRIKNPISHLRKKLSKILPDCIEALLNWLTQQT